MDPLLWEYKQSIAKRYGEHVNYKILTDSNPPKGSLMKSHEEFDCSDQWYCDTESGRQQVRSDLGWAKTDSTKQAQPAHCPIHLRIISTSQVGSFEGVSSNSFSTSVTWQHGLHHSQKKNNGNYGTVNNVKSKLRVITPLCLPCTSAQRSPHCRCFFDLRHWDHPGDGGSGEYRIHRNPIMLKVTENDRKWSWTIRMDYKNPNRLLKRYLFYLILNLPE